MNWKAIAACALTGVALMAAGCGGGGQSASKAESAAQGQNLKGKKLVMYVSFHEDTAKELADLFKKKTGADVSFIRLPTGEARLGSRQKKMHRKRISGSEVRQMPMPKRLLTVFWKPINRLMRR